jgi:cytochrome c oxidase subunit 4
MVSHPEPKKTYFSVFGALMVFTAATVYAATFELGPLNAVVALTIAVTKATLVVLYFMHLRHSQRLTQFVVAAGFLWLVILIALTLSDYASRHWLPVPQAWQ